MTQVKKFWPLLMGSLRYDKALSTRGRGDGVIIEAPILAYLIETSNGRILYDVGCDYRKIADAALRDRYYPSEKFPFGPPVVSEAQRIPNRLKQLGLRSEDIDVVFVGHLHFDHGGGLPDVAHADIHVHTDEFAAAINQADSSYFADEVAGDYNWNLVTEEYDLCPGVSAIETPGHTAGHMSLWVELPKGAPIIIAGDAADLVENLEENIAPGMCWQNREDLALQSIGKLKRLAAETGAEIWPNHDIAFFKSRRPFPLCYE